MIRRLLILLTVLLFVFASAGAELAFPSDTHSQELLADYIGRVNADLSAIRAKGFNSLFLCFPTSATLGVTADEGAEIPEDV